MNQYKILISTDNFDYSLYNINQKIFINGKILDLNINELSSIDKKEYLKNVNSYISAGKTKEYSKIKSILYYTDYIEIESSALIELIDTVILYLLGVLKLTTMTSNMKIIITKDRIFTSKNQKRSRKYSIDLTASCFIDYDFELLLNQLIKDNNINEMK